MNDPSPYQTPRSAIKPTESGPFGEVRIFSAQSRLGRVRYIGYSMGLGLLSLLCYGLMAGLSAVFKENSSGDLMGLLVTGVLLVVWVATIAISVILAIQRLHDFNASGWWSLLAVAPLVNLALYLTLLIMPGTPGPNRFGNRPPPNTLSVILLALIPPLIAVIGIIAAIVIPAYMDYTERARQATINSAPLQE